MITIVLLVSMTSFIKTVKAETLTMGWYPIPYDFNLNYPHCTSGQHRTTTPLPSGQWYTNINFDPDPSNYANITGGYAYLRAYSYATFWPDMHGWSNAYFHQGRVPYSGGIYEGKFKAFDLEVDGIKYQLWNEQQTDIYYEPEGGQWLEIRVKITKRYVNSMNAFASVLFFALFQYEFNDGTLSLYDSPPFTNDMQSLHYDIFLSRACRFFGWYWEDGEGTETTDWGDAYNGDIHVQRVVGKMNVGQWYTFKLDWGFLLNRAKIMFITTYYSYYNTYPYHVKYLILRWIGLSAEVIGSELEVQVDYIKFYDTYGWI